MTGTWRACVTHRNDWFIHATNRWKACRLGAGALFGDRPMRGPTTGGSQTAASSQAQGIECTTPAPAQESAFSPALETAITAGETELLEIGFSSYRRYLATGVTERMHRAVAVLKATEALVRGFARKSGSECRRGSLKGFFTMRDEQYGDKHQPCSLIMYRSNRSSEHVVPPSKNCRPTRGRLLILMCPPGVALLSLRQHSSYPNETKSLARQAAHQMLY